MRTKQRTPMTRVPVLKFVQQNFSTVGIFILAGAANLKDRNFKTQEKESHRNITALGCSGMRQEIFKELCYQDTAAGLEWFHQEEMILFAPIKNVVSWISWVARCSGWLRSILGLFVHSELYVGRMNGWDGYHIHVIGHSLSMCVSLVYPCHHCHCFYNGIFGCGGSSP